MFRNQPWISCRACQEFPPIERLIQVYVAPVRNPGRSRELIQFAGDAFIHSIVR
jgi:hypothetical protein